MRRARKGDSQAVALPDAVALNRAQTEIISEFLDRLPDGPERLWSMELGTELIIASANTVGVAQFVALCCAKEPEREHVFEGGESAVSIYAIRQAIRARGLGVRGMDGDSIRAAGVFLVAAAAALAMLALDLLRYRGSRRDALPADGTWLAAQGEWSNRTRHLLARVPEGAVVPLLLAGRPRQRDAGIQAILERQLPGRTFRLVRPWSLRSFLASLGEIARQFAAGMRVIAHSPHLPRVRDLAATAYRFAWGATAAHWWHASAAPPRILIYAHSCNADTSLLERAQQERGAVTVHLFHGLSQGHNFAGISDIAVPLCRHDEQLHERIGRYRRIRTFADPAPAPAPARRAWLLLTNYANPLNPDFRATGVAVEARVIRMAAQAASRLNVAPPDVTYRPHPIFAKLASAHQHEIRACVRAAGFSFWPEDQPYEDAASYGCVITTPSTSAVDLLRWGRLAVLLDLRGADRATANGAFPLIAAGLDELVAAIDAVGKHHDELFRQAWSRVGPARLPALAEIEAAAREEDWGTRRCAE
jgi:hypothetical protein